jgi:hypothetical protein
MRALVEFLLVEKERGKIEHEVALRECHQKDEKEASSRLTGGIITP